MLAANPFPDAVDDPKSLHVSFLAEACVDPDLNSLDVLKSPTENYELLANAFYLHAPDGIGRSRLVARVEKYLRVPATGRNWRTTTKLAELAASIIS